MTIKQSEIQYQRYDNSCLGDLHLLHNKVFRGNLSREFLARKYDTRWLGVKDLCCIAYHNDVAVAFYGVIAYEMIYQGKKVLACQTCDYITLKEYRKMGIQKELALLSVSIMREENVKIAFSMNSVQSWKVTEGLGWIDLGDMARCHIPVLNVVQRPFSYLRRSFSSRYRRYISWVLSHYAVDRETFKNPLNDHFLSVNYSSEFMHYKSYARNFVIRIDECVAWVRITKVFGVGAIDGLTADNFPRIIAKLKRLAGVLMLNELMFHVSRDTPIFSLLSSKYEIYDSWKTGCYVIDNSVPFKNLRLNYADFDTY